MIASRHFIPLIHSRAVLRLGQLSRYPDPEMSEDSLRWFGIRTIYRSQQSDTEFTYSYEERVVVFSAYSIEAAIELAERESQDYIDGTDEIALDFLDVFEIYDGQISNGTEVFSLIRDSNLESDEYLSTFFDTGNERRGTLD